ncbi:MAG: GNAT family N-acetyltransferase, partial [Bacteroidales bacterium]|nr:GNAT family N-acetyltransferase [Bacteroidales bacterium]
AYSQKDVEDWQALLKGVGGGAISWLTENFNDTMGYGGTKWSRNMKQKVSESVASGIGKALLRHGFSASSEAGEEVAEALLGSGWNWILNKMVDLVGHGAKFDSAVSAEELVTNSVSAFLSTLIAEGGSTAINTRLQSNANINQMEQQQGRELTAEEKRQVRKDTLLENEMRTETQTKNEGLIDDSSLSRNDKNILKDSLELSDMSQEDVQKAIKEAETNNKLIDDSNLSKNQKQSLKEASAKTNMSSEKVKEAIKRIAGGEEFTSDEATIENNESLNQEEQTNQGEKKLPRKVTSPRGEVEKKQGILQKKQKQDKKKVDEIAVQELQERLPISKAKANEFVEKIKNIENPTTDDVKSLVKEINKTAITQKNEDIKTIRKDINNTTFALTDSLSEELKSVYGNIPRNVKFSKDGASVDTVYKELHEQYGNVFPNDTTNEKDMMIEIIDFMKNQKASERIEYEVLNDEEIDNLSAGMLDVANWYKDIDKAYESEINEAGVTDNSIKTEVKEYLEKTGKKATGKNIQAFIERASNFKFEESDNSNPELRALIEKIQKHNIKQDKIEDKKIETFSTDSHDGQTDYIKQITDDNGNVIAKVEYSHYNGQNYVNMIEVKPEYRRQGLAKKLLQDLQAETPNTQIVFGMTTKDGTKLIESITEKVKNPQYNEKKAKKINKLEQQANEIRKQIEDYNNKLRPFAEKNRNGTLTEQEHEEWSKLGREQIDLMNQEREVNEEWYKLEQKTKPEELREYDTFVKMGSSNNVDESQKKEYNKVNRKPQDRNYTYKKISKQDKARVESDYKQYPKKYTEPTGFVNFSDVTYGYDKFEDRIEVVSKFKGSQEYINKVEEELKNGANRLPKRNTKIDERFRNREKTDNNGNDVSRRPRESGESNKRVDKTGRQGGTDNKGKLDENISNSINVKNSKQSSFSMPKNVKEIKNMSEFLRKTYEQETNKEWKNRLYDAMTANYWRLDKRRSPLKYKREVVQQYLDYKNGVAEDSIETNKSTDSQGRTLSKQQQERNKNSKFRDNDGNLLALHHVTDKQFNVFEAEKYGANTGERLKGIYLSTKPMGAFGDVDMELYANVTNPVTKNDNNITKEQFEELCKIKFPNISKSNLESAWESLRHTNDLYILQTLSPRNAQDNQKFIDNVIRITGYDGAIYNDEEADVNNRVYVAFNSNQVKNIDNTNPTNNSDIRYSLSDEEIQAQGDNSEQNAIDLEINQSMTPKEAEEMIQRAFVKGDIYDWFDGKYRNGLEWLKGEGSDAVALVLDNDGDLYFKYHTKIDGIINDRFTMEDVLDAYMNGTLTGKTKTGGKRLAVETDTGFKDDRFYAPKEATEGIELYNKANERVTNKNREEIYKARADFIINAQQEGYIESLGIDSKEAMQKMKQWANYNKRAYNLSNYINKDTSLQNRWSGIENSSIVNHISTTEEQLESMVKEVKGNSSEYERKYITATLLAIDCHTDFSNVTFDFTDKILQDRDSILGQYNPKDDVISIRVSGQNTVAHEIGHFIDHLFGRQLFGNNSGITDHMNLYHAKDDAKLTTNQKQFVENFAKWFEGVESSASLSSTYTMTPTEVFARFVARFTEWTKNVATNNHYGYETKWYNDNFTEPQFIQFAKLLQEKALLDTTETYENYKKEDFGGGKIREDRLEDFFDDSFDTEETNASIDEDLQAFREETEKLGKKTMPRKHYKTYSNTESIDKKSNRIAKNLYKSEQYIPISNTQTMTNANNKIQKGGVENTYIELTNRFNTNDKMTLQDIATGERLIQIFSQRGDYAKVNELMQDIAILGTELGQQVQALSIIKRASPEGQLQMLQRLIERTNNKEGTDIALTDEQAKRILESKNEKELQNNVSKVTLEVAQQLPITFKDKLRSWRYLSMLGNPRTHIRNIVGNVAMYFLQGGKNVVAGAGEDIASIFNPNLERTKTLRRATQAQKDYAKEEASK